MRSSHALGLSEVSKEQPWMEQGGEQSSPLRSRAGQKSVKKTEVGWSQ